MTEEEWLSNEKNIDRLRHLRDVCGWTRTKPGRRKLRLFGCAVCRVAWTWLEPDRQARQRVEVAERLADGVAGADEVELARTGKLPGSPNDPASCASYAAREVIHKEAFAAAVSPAAWLWHALSDWSQSNPSETHIDPERLHSTLLRCIAGNPFRPVAFDPACRTSTIVALAEGIYADRAFDRLPILADALEDAGCGHPYVLAHCRGDGPHARGCWVVDVVLGKA